LSSRSDKENGHIQKASTNRLCTVENLKFREHTLRRAYLDAGVATLSTLFTAQPGREHTRVLLHRHHESIGEQSVSQESASPTITLDQIAEILAENEYEVVNRNEDDGVIRARDLDTGLLLTSVLRDSVLFNSVALHTIAKDKISADLMWTLLDGGNGISTSNFQLYESANGVTVALNNFAKLQELGEDDKDDILSCLEFLVVDAWAANELLRGKLA
jgi:hypothetical protein